MSVQNTTFYFRRAVTLPSRRAGPDSRREKNGFKSPLPLFGAVRVNCSKRHCDNGSHYVAERVYDVGEEEEEKKFNASPDVVATGLEKIRPIRPNGMPLFCDDLPSTCQSGFTVMLSRTATMGTQTRSSGRPTAPT
ncbi:hypothetical protein ANANG_G00055300, partial [Anguilla anguilla]